MQDLEIKKSILKEIMDMTDAREAEGLKKHPKLVAAKVEVSKPEAEEAEMMESEEKPAEMMDAEKSEDEISPEDLERLMELHKSLKA